MCLFSEACQALRQAKVKGEEFSLNSWLETQRHNRNEFPTAIIAPQRRGTVLTYDCDTATADAIRPNFPYASYQTVCVVL